MAVPNGAVSWTARCLVLRCKQIFDLVISRIDCARTPSFIVRCAAETKGDLGERFLAIFPLRVVVAIARRRRCRSDRRLSSVP